MPVTYVKASIAEAQENLILHGCNCFCTMGRGVAEVLRKKWPEVSAVDRRTKKGDRSKLGTYSGAGVGPDQFVLNCYIQFKYGWHKKHLDLDALDQVLARVAVKVGERDVSIAMPYMGCGTAGGDWETEVLPLVEKHLGHLQVKVYSP